MMELYGLGKESRVIYSLNNKEITKYNKIKWENVFIEHGYPRVQLEKTGA
jgi:hypothetical protein